MAEGQDECREAFEKWAAGIPHLPLTRERNYLDEYEQNLTRISWNAWQAAWNTRALSGLVEALEEIAYAPHAVTEADCANIEKAALAKRLSHKSNIRGVTSVVMVCE